MTAHETPRRYTIGEAVKMLGCDRVTLSDWLEKEHMHAELDPRDKRSKLLTRDQLRVLARIHGKEIHDEVPTTPRLTGVQRDMLARIERNEKQTALLSATLGTAMEIVREVADGDVYRDVRGSMLVVSEPDALLAKARALLSGKGEQGE